MVCVTVARCPLSSGVVTSTRLCRVGDEQPPIRRVCQHLGGEAQRAGDGRLGIGREGERRSVSVPSAANASTATPMMRSNCSR